MEFLNFRTQKEIQDAGYVVQNGTLKNLDIELNLHFGNCVSLTGIVETENGGVAAPFGLRNTTKDIGFILQAIFDLLDLSREEGRNLSSIKNVPCRLIASDNKAYSTCLGIGNKTKDKFIYIEDLMKMKGKF